MKIRSIVLATCLALAAPAWATCPTTTNRGLEQCPVGTASPTWVGAYNSNWGKLDFKCNPPLLCPSTTLSLDVVPATLGGLGQSAWAKGESPYVPATNTISKLSPNVTTTRKFRCQTGNGSAVTEDGWCAPSPTDLPTPLITDVNQIDPALCLTGKILKRGGVAWQCDDDAGSAGGGGDEDMGGSSGTTAMDTAGATNAWLPLFGIGYADNAAGDLESVCIPISKAGKFKNISCRNSAVPGATGSDGYRVMPVGVNGGTDNPICTMHGSARTCQVATQSVTYNADDCMGFYVAFDGTPNTGIAIKCGIQFTPN